MNPMWVVITFFSEKSNTEISLIWDAFRNLVRFVQFQKLEKHPWRSVSLDCNLNKSNTPPWVFFEFFKLYKWNQIAQSIFSEYTVNWFKSYLSNRSFLVILGNNFSKPAFVSCGITQGSILGPLLFFCRYQWHVTSYQMWPFSICWWFMSCL